MWLGTILERDIDRVRDIILEIIGKSPLYLKKSLTDLVEADGKMLRPGFLIICSGFGNPKRDVIANLAAAVEILHLATLIHDDIIDDSLTRRGVPTLHTIYGPRDAVLAGDFLLSACVSMVSKYASPEDAGLVSAAVSHIVASEINQWKVGKAPSQAGIRSYLRRIAGKTAALFLLSCHVGASRGEASIENTELLRRIGYNTGMAFQIMDDILDYRGSETDLRKPAGKDIANGIVTLPLILAAKCAAVGSRETVGKYRRYRPETYLGKKPPKRKIPGILKAVRESGALAEAEARADAYTNRALRAAMKLPERPEKTLLTEIINKLGKRPF